MITYVDLDYRLPQIGVKLVDATAQAAIIVQAQTIAQADGVSSTNTYFDALVLEKASELLCCALFRANSPAPDPAIYGNAYTRLLTTIKANEVKTYSEGVTSTVRTYGKLRDLTEWK